MLFETPGIVRLAVLAIGLAACNANLEGTGNDGSGGNASPSSESGGTAGSIDEQTGGINAGGTVTGTGGVTESGGAGGNPATGGTTPNSGGSGSGGTANTTGGAAGTTPIANLKPAIMAAGYGGIRVVSFDDGKTWRNRKVEDPNGGDDGNLIRAINYVNGVWIGAGWKIFRSEDGLSWTQISESTVPGGWYDCVTYDEAKQIWIVKVVRADAGGQNGGAVISKDAGKTWVNSKEPTRCDRQPVPYNTGTAQLRSAWKGKIERSSGGGFTQVLQDCCSVEMFARGMAVDERVP
jgi:hypothetical protein